ncbi:hypothetical protein [Enterobacter phage ZX14]
MSFYEGCGPDISPKSGVNSAEYTDELIAVTRHLKHNQRDMIQSFAVNTRLPMDIIKIAAKYPSSKITNSDWAPSRSSIGSNDFKAGLAPAFVLNDMNNIIKFFKEVDGHGQLKIIDIYSLEYSIFAFNNDERNWQSLKKSVSAFNNRSDNTYYIALEFNKTKFGVIITTGDTVIGKLSYTSDKIKSLKEYWFPKIDEYFHKAKGRNQDRSIIVLDFVDQCRANIKARKGAYDVL